MSVNPRRATRARRPRSRDGVNVLAALFLVLGLLLVGTACGRNAQTLRPYTPGEGVNADVGDPADPTMVVHVRNLVVIAKEGGQGVLSASMVTGGQDSLVGVSGNAVKGDGSQGAPLNATLSTPVALAPSTLVVLASDPATVITVRSADLAPGLVAVVTLQFEKAGEVTLRAPVVDGAEAQYASIAPSAAPSA